MHLLNLTLSRPSAITVRWWQRVDAHAFCAA